MKGLWFWRAMFYVSLAIFAILFVITVPVWFFGVIFVVTLAFAISVAILGYENNTVQIPDYDRARNAVIFVLYGIAADFILLFGWILYNRMTLFFIPAIFIVVYAIIRIKIDFFMIVPSTPNNFAYAEIWHKRLNRTFGPGTYLHFPHPPINLKFNLVPVTSRTTEYTMQLLLKDNGKPTVRVDLTYWIIWKPDPTRSDLFLNANLDEGVVKQTAVNVEDEVEVYTENMEWEDFLGNKPQLRRILARALTGKDTIDVGGLPDNKNMGIIVERSLIKDPIPKSETIVSAMEQQAVEVRERSSQKLQNQTDHDIAIEIVNNSKTAGIPIPYDQALRIAIERRQLDEGKASKNYTEVQGDSLSAAVMGLINKAKGGGKP